jgi:TatD DNase family protein
MDIPVYIDIHAHNRINNDKVLALHNIDPAGFSQLTDKENQFFSVGIHPWYIDDHVDESLKTLASIASDPSILAIGEIGLDKYCATDFELQQTIFNKQLLIAKEIRKPVIIHCVKAWNETTQLLKEVQFDLPVIFHGFRGKPQLAKELTKAGFYLSFGNLFNNESVEIMPFDRIFLETDDKDVAIEEIYNLIAEVKGVSIEKLIETVGANFKRALFNLS